MDTNQPFDKALDAHEANTFSFEAPASPVDDDNDLVFYGDRNEGQTLPFTHDA